MANKTLVTSYKTPDLDGTACMIAYAALLNNSGQESIAAAFGQPQKEAMFVLNRFAIPYPAVGEDIIKADIPVILVDASDTVGLSSHINPAQVIEIIDHRQFHDAVAFSHAKIQIEQVGAAATLIAEKYFQANAEISEQTAILLFSAIVSNTVNFHATVTTERDHAMAVWLKSKISLPENYIHEMFTYKSQFTKPLKQEMEDTIAKFSINNKKLVVAQLEIVEAETFVNNNREEIISSLKKFKEEDNADFVFLTCIDVEEAKNIFVCEDDSTQKLLMSVFNLQFRNAIAHRSGVLMRKVIKPMIYETLMNNSN